MYMDSLMYIHAEIVVFGSGSLVRAPLPGIGKYIQELSESSVSVKKLRIRSVIH